MNYGIVRLALALSALAAAAAFVPLQTASHVNYDAQRNSMRSTHLAFAASAAQNLASRGLHSTFLGCTGNVYRKNAPGSTLSRRITVRNSVLALRAQVNPRNSPPPQKQEPVVEPGVIDWDAVGMQFKLFTKMALPYFKEEKSAR